MRGTRKKRKRKWGRRKSERETGRKEWKFRDADREMRLGREGEKVTREE